jgi:hypothetical protein
MTELLEIIVDFLQEDGWPFTPVEGQTALRTAFQGENGQWTCYALALEEQRQFVFYSVCPVNASEEKRPAMAEFLTRANYGLFVGNFEMDWSDGEIRYKTGIDVEGDRLSQALVQQMVYANVVSMDRYLPGIMKVLYGHLSPAEAVAELER